MVQQLEDLVQHDGHGRDAHAVLEPEDTRHHPSAAAAGGRLSVTLTRAAGTALLTREH